MAGQATVAAGPFLPDFPFAPSYEKKTFSLEAARKYLEAASEYCSGYQHRAFFNCSR